MPFNSGLVRLDAFVEFICRIIDRVVREKDRFLAAPLQYLTRPGLKLLEVVVDFFATTRFIPKERREAARAYLRELILWPLRQLPNALSLVRVYLAWLLFTYPIQDPYFYLQILFWAVITDIYDGITAREYGRVTWLGEWLDPFCDKLIEAAALYHFWNELWQPVAITCAVLESSLLILGVIGAAAKLLGINTRTKLGSNKLGQAKFVTYGISFLLLIFALNTAANLVLIIGVALAAGSIYRHVLPQPR